MLIKESWAYQYQPYSSALAVMGELLKYVPISVVEAFKAIKDLFVDGATLNECEALAYVITMIGFPLAIGFAYSAWDISIPVIRSLILVVLSMICAFLCSMLVALVVAVMEFFTSGEDVLRFFGLLAFFVAVFAPPGIVIVAISD